MRVPAGNGSPLINAGSLSTYPAELLTETGVWYPNWIYFVNVSVPPGPPDNVQDWLPLTGGMTNWVPEAPTAMLPEMPGPERERLDAPGTCQLSNMGHPTPPPSQLTPTKLAGTVPDER
jgi:hypothetical protein